MNSSRNQYLETASRIGARICRDAIWSGDRCNWLGDSMEKLDGSWKVAHRALGPDFYGGTSGIALFLNCLHAFTGERLFRETAEGAILQACSRIPHLPPKVRPSLYLGVIGIAYTLIAMGLEEKAREALGVLTHPGQLSTDAHGYSLDVIGGIAGAIPPLLAMGLELSDNALVTLATNYGEDLLHLAKKSAAGWSWNTMGVPPEQRREDLTGFSHGAAGIAWALSELFQYTKDARFRVAAEEARRYESSHFNLQFSNWPDFRYLYDPDSPNKNGPSYPISWCHGAPGIGLDRLRAYEIFGGRRLKEEAEIAMRTTETILTFAKGSNFSLCHGLGGNGDLLIYSSAVLNNPTLMALPEQVGEQGIEEIERQDLRWPCGVTDGDETPNLMLGTAGIGYFYLRLYDPCRVPSVLIFPTRARTNTVIVVPPSAGNGVPT
jgi:lantibiotic modifying enzyme